MSNPFYKDVEKVSVVPGTKVDGRPLILLTMKDDIAVSDQDVDRLRARWYKLYPDVRLVVIFPGCKAQVVGHECIVRESCSGYEYEVHGRTPEEVIALAKHFNLSSVPSTSGRVCGTTAKYEAESVPTETDRIAKLLNDQWRMQKERAK